MGCLRGLRRKVPFLGSSLSLPMPLLSALCLSALLASCVTGCRSGSATALPSWSMFGGSNKASSTLAAAPPFEGDVAKPSASAKPYPTTSTPDGYVLDNGTGRPADPSAASGPADGGAVVYGSPPPTPAAAPAAEPAAAYAAAPAVAPTSAPGVDAPMSSIVPQVGPYAAATPATPALVEASPPPDAAGGQSSPAGFAAAPGFDGPASPPERMADARGATSWAADRGATPPQQDMDPSAGSSRYAGGSRFAGGGTAQPAAAAWPAAQTGNAGEPPAAWPAATSAPAPFSESNSSPPAAFPTAAPPGTQPPSFPTAPAASNQAAPAALPDGPVRRPDPGYRPGGTSNYRRVGPEGGDVQPASYEPPFSPLP